MPKIVITEQDATGLIYDVEHPVVFVPGKTNLTEEVMDANNCFLIKAGKTSSTRTINLPEALKDNNYIITLLTAGCDVLYWYTEEDLDAFEEPAIEFLKDKNAYDVRFLTTGGVRMFQTKDEGCSSNLYKTYLDIASTRGDCAVICSLDASINSINNIKIWLDNYLGEKSLNSNRAYAIAAKIIDKDVLSYPDLAYITSYAKAVADGNQWESIANWRRGATNCPDSALVSKYDLDNQILDSEKVAGYSFNGIINLRTYGPTIWGDRTLANNEKGNLKATSFMSIRMMICDIAKRAYQAAIDYTYETNNDITWTNFKAQISELLDQMVSANAISFYDIKKVPFDDTEKLQARYKIKCQIHIIPFYPVEDFDINIYLTDADAEVIE